MQFSDRARISLQKTVSFSSLSGPSVGRIEYAPTTGYVRSFEILMQFPNWIRAALQKTVLFSSPSRSRGGRIQYAPTTGYVRSFEISMRFPNRVRAALQKNYPVFVPFGAACGAYSIRPYNRVCAILQNTDAIPQPDTCNPSKYRYDLLTEGAGVFGMWGGGGYRLRGRRA